MAQAHRASARERTTIPEALDPRVPAIVRRALEEDLGAGDLSGAPLFSEQAQLRAAIQVKQDGIIAGLPVAEMVFRELDENVIWKAFRQDGDEVRAGQAVAELAGKARAILAGERTALNFLQRMSGIATETRRYVEAVAGTKAKILDTRKTAPGLRVLDKYAVRAGGGCNHRFGLYDGVMLKDNHIAAAGGIENAVNAVRKNIPNGKRIEVEVTNLEQAQQALRAKAEIIMLDNMAHAEMKKAVELIGGRALVEASGGITIESVREIALTGVDWISVGALTHSAKALDFSLEVTE